MYALHRIKRVVTGRLHSLGPFLYTLPALGGSGVMVNIHWPTTREMLVQFRSAAPMLILPPKNTTNRPPPEVFPFRKTIRGLGWRRTRERMRLHESKKESKKAARAIIYS